MSDGPVPAFAFDVRSVERVLPIEGLTADWAWGDGSGKGVKVAIIDSGVDSGHSGLLGPVTGYVNVRSRDDGTIEYDMAPHADSYGHGTACAGIVRSIAPACEIYSVKVLGPALLGSGAAFTAGLRWAIENEMDVCNLSLGTTRKEFFATLHELADTAYFKNIILVTAANNMPVPSFPSVYASVISVSSHAVDDPTCFYYNPEPPVEFGAHGINVQVCWLHDSHLTVTGNSFAAPHITGLVTRIRARHPRPGLTAKTIGPQSAPARGCEPLTAFQIKSVLHALASNVGTNAAGSTQDAP